VFDPKKDPLLARLLHGSALIRTMRQKLVPGGLGGDLGNTAGKIAIAKQFRDLGELLADADPSHALKLLNWKASSGMKEVVSMLMQNKLQL
jgi:hypothetical protein